MAPPPGMIGDLLWQLGFAICHQLPERSFTMGGYQMPLCARDVGLSLGFVMVLLLYVLSGRRTRSGAPDCAVLAFVAVSSVFFLLDAAGSYLQLVEATNASRSASGLMFGASAGMLLTAIWSKLIVQGKDPRPVYAWSDLAILILPMALVFMALNVMDLGLAGYYIISTTAIAGFLLMVGSVLLLLVTMVMARWGWARSGWGRLAVAACLESLLVAGLYAFHSYGVSLGAG